MSFLLSVKLFGIDLSLVLWIGITVAVILFGIYSAVLLWHWKEYSTGKFTTVANMFIYAGVGGGLLVMMALATLWYGLT